MSWRGRVSEAAVIAKIIFVMIGTHTTGYETGIGAYYHQRPGLMREVCQRRVAHGWNPGLDCSWPCLAAGMDASEIGDYVLADLPGHSMVVCHIVDCPRAEHKAALLKRGEVIELDWFTAMAANWTGYTPNVRIWRLER